MPRLRPLLALVELEPRAVPAAAEPVDLTDEPAVPDWDVDTLANVRRIADAGRALGRNPNGFLKVGDSNTATPGFLTQYGAGNFNADVAGLTAVAPEVIDTFLKYRSPLRTGDNSFSRTSAAAYPGWAIPNVMQTVAAEVAATNAAVAVVMIGSNDQVLFPLEAYRANLLGLVDTLAAFGVVPLLSSIPAISDAWHRNDVIDDFNAVIVEVAEERDLPFFNPYGVQRTLPFLGLDAGGIHLTTSPRGGGWAQSLDLEYGQNSRNLVTLKALDQFQDAAYGTPPAPKPPPIPDPTLTEWAPLDPGEPVVAVGAPAGSPAVVRLTDPATGRTLATVRAYEAGFTGGVRVATGDVNGDGVTDVVTAPGPGGGPHVRAFSGTDGAELFSLFAFEPSFAGGATVSVGDADRDGTADVVIGAGTGGGPRVLVVRATDRVVTADYFAFEPSFRGGVNVTATAGEVLAAPGVGGGGVVARFGPGGRPLGATMVFETGFRGGLSLAAGDVTGDGWAEVVAAPATGATRVRVLTTAGAEVASFDAGGDNAAGVRVAVVGGRIVTGAADPERAVRAFDRNGTQLWRAAGSDEPFLAAGPFVG